MHNKSNLLLLTLFTLAVGVVGWLGYKLTSQQDQQIKMSQINRSEQALLLMQNNINTFVKSFDNKFSQLLNDSLIEIEDKTENDPLIHSVLIFNDSDELIFPIHLSTNKQKAGYQWLHFLSNASDNNEVSSNNAGWFVWYDQQKEKYIYWLKNKNTRLFIEINNSMFMAELIHYLAQQPNIAGQSYLQIVDNIGRTFYQWGNNDLLKQADFDLQKNLSTPLSGWSLQYYSSIQSLSPWSKYLFQIIVIGMIVLLSIITLILFQLKRREQKEAQQKLSFINQVSHELKTPLTNIRLHGELLEMTFSENDLNENTVKSLAIIQQESERLTRLINNVLNFNSIDKNTLQLIPSQIEFDDLMSQAIGPFLPSFQQLDTGIEFQNNIKHTVNVDVDVFKQIIGNLLSNIEKYAPQSEHIYIHSSKQVGSKYFTVTIQDEGEGISEKLSEKIFKPFYRIRSHLTDAAGSGLGLGLARDLARLHGGDLVLVKNKTGACFKLTIKELT